MLETLDLRDKTGDYLAHLPRPKAASSPPIDAVREIIAAVKDHRDAALVELTRRFDNVELGEIEVSRFEMQAAYERIDSQLRDALEVAAEAIRGYYELELHEDREFHHNGVIVSQMTIPVAVAGCYVPGGKARYPSSVLMTAIPARVAGVEEVVLCVPPGPDGKVDDATLAAAFIASIDHLYSVGGAQAIAAMAYGTETVKRCDVIVGPGNIYVSLAKREVAGDVGIPTAFAGPSEVVVIADASVPPEWALMDVIVQAEHGPDGMAWLITWDPALASAADAMCASLLESSPRKAETQATLHEGGFVVLVRDFAQAIEVSNAIAPEHLEILSADYEKMIPLIQNAGAVFVGQYGTAAIGDYLAGPSHVLPTYGTARFGSALSVVDFQKRVHLVETSAEGIARLAPHLSAIAAAEGLWAHARSAQMRVEP